MEGFLSYQEPVEIIFTSFDVACITGENGSGKSSILDGITWALFGRARKHDESIINLNSSKAEVTFIFNYEGNQYRVVRSNPRGGTKLLEFHIRGQDTEDALSWNPLTERTIRDTDQKIVDVLNLNYESFINASFLLQGEADLFTQQNPSTRKRILSQILGLEIWDDYRKTSYQKRKKAESELDLLDGRISEILTELDQEEDRIAHLNNLEKALSEALYTRKSAEKHLTDQESIRSYLKEQESLVNTLNKNVTKTTENITAIKQKIIDRQQERDSFQEILSQSESINLGYDNLNKAQESLADWEDTAVKYREGENKRQDPLLKIAAEKARLLQEHIMLVNQQQELQESQKSKTELSKNLAEIKKEIKEGESELKIRDQKKTELDQAREEQADAKAENPRLYKEMKDLEKRISELEKTEGAVCPLCGQELSSTDRKSLIQNLETEGKDLGDRYRKNQAILEQAEELVKDLHLQITKLSLIEKGIRSQVQESDKITNKINQLDAEKNNWEKEHKKNLEIIQETLENESYAMEERQLLANINDELKDIGYDAAEHDRIREIVNQGAAIHQNKVDLDSAEAALKPIRREIKELTEQLDENQNHLDQSISDLNHSQESLQKAIETAPDTKEAEKELLKLKEKENILQRDVGAAQQKVAVLDSQKKRKTELEKERLTHSERVKQFQQLESAFGKDGVPALLIEQALPNIEAKANQILGRLSAESMSIRFLTQREFKDSSRDDLKETLDIQIRDQAGFRDYELYSGGESFRINFAIRLALSHVLTQRAGARLQTLVIDEGFGSQDAVGRQRLIEAINLIRNDFEKILVITHVEQIKEAFSTQLLVEKTPTGSQVTLV